ncbi:MAG TPA: glutamyl-tRNA reductase [Lacipirellulaceae bacterium]|nr:glutamyl-tRNA reductase [Lacipirellulaceae bacterium]
MSTVRLAMVGCSHRLSSLAVRERLSFTPEQTRDALAAWRVTHPDREAVLLSTCHRVELYAAAANPQASVDPPSLAEYLASFHNVPMDEIRSELLSLEGDDVVRHLFRVAASLDSMVLGEAQILSQVKQAYEMASEIGSLGPVINGAFQAAIRARRRIANETSLYRHRVSIPSVAIADFASRIFEQFGDKRVLVVGAGKMAQETLQYLTDAGAKQIVVLNRNLERAQSLAAHWQGQAAPWTELSKQLVSADIVVSTTGADRPVVTLYDYRENIARRRHQRPLFVLDLAMPRDFEPEIGDELGVYLYGIDDLTEACAQNRQARAEALPTAEQIIEEEVRSFLAEARHRASAPVITRFRRSLENVQTTELDRLYARLPELDDRSRQEIRQFADRLLAKMLHPPLESLRHESRNGSPHGLLEALQRLFQLKEKDD